MSKYFQETVHKLDPKLRMVCNGSDVVNTLRSERAPSISVRNDALLAGIQQMRTPDDRGVLRMALPPEVTRGHLDQLPESVYASVFILLAAETEELSPQLQELLVHNHAIRNQNIIAATVEISQLPKILDDPSVLSVEGAKGIAFYPPIEIAQSLSEPGVNTHRANLPPSNLPGSAEKPQVLVGIIDVQGFDFAHPDFLKEDGATRFVSIWDQGGSNRPAPPRFGYGSVLTQEIMNLAIQNSKDPQFGLPATTLEPQSQMIPASHGTHVASIAAGNSGICPNAAIAAVLISLPTEDIDRRKSLYDSTRLAHAVDYLFELGEKMNLPVSINVSLGTNGHAHDASSTLNRWIDYELANAGRSVCVAAGNAGQEKPARPGDWGYVMGRIHTAGNLKKTGLSMKVPAPKSSREVRQKIQDIFWLVVGDGVADLSENELEIWYSPGDQFAIMVKPPTGEWIGPVEPGQYIENMEIKNQDGQPNGNFLSVYNEFYSPTNGHNYISCYLSPFFSPQGVVGVESGTWIVRLIGRDMRDGEYHAWIERDDPRRLGRVGMQEGWSFPSFFSERSNVDNTSIGSLACGNYVVGVANYDEKNERIHITSSQGPTRDGRPKPDIAAPGTSILAANGFDPQRPWVQMTGTSMASPYVAGVIALMLAAEPRLTAAQITGILRRTARPLKSGRYDWRDDSGYGFVDPAACLEEVRAIGMREELEL